jgi:hypothetical protein
MANKAAIHHREFLVRRTFIPHAIIAIIRWTHEEGEMANLVVRNLDQRIVDALKQRAAKHGRSAEAEHRAILEEVLFATAQKDRQE